jgi:HEAT repeat protein
MNLKLHSHNLCSVLSGSLLGVWLLAWPAGSGAVPPARPHPGPSSTLSQPVAQDTSTVQTKTEPPAETLDRSWKLLTDNVQDAKHVDSRTQALNALSDLGSIARADGLIAAAMKDSDLDVRSAAILAAGKAKARALDEPVQKLLDDPEPQVVFAAATTLWKEFRDHSGEDILAAVAAGDRKANPTLIHGAEHDMSRTMHSPSALAKIGLTTGAGLVLGPFGFSISAVEYARKNGGDNARVQAIELLAQERTEGVRDQMKSTLDDSDAGVRAAAVRVLGGFHRAEDAADIAVLLDDSKLPVRLAAAAAYIDCRTGVAKARTKVGASTGGR